jgi:hypothetical protein
MFNKKKSEIQTTWSEKMLKEFIDSFLSRFRFFRNYQWLVEGCQNIWLGIANWILSKSTRSIE